ncbi:hypothetical protein HID58_076553 [Brassica napus]|uniref:Uncharacterized protein n=1 Tax=Brassica napus TaxID=3708 RepID=A0ABQ7YQY5_BRANA|nr:hypothetical protein HID58_076553 [Brassica napus]
MFDAMFSGKGSRSHRSKMGTSKLTIPILIFENNNRVFSRFIYRWLACNSIYTDHDWLDAGRCSNRLCSWMNRRISRRENGDAERNVGLLCRLSLEMMLKSLSNQHYHKYYSLFICEHA